MGDHSVRTPSQILGEDTPTKILVANFQKRRIIEFDSLTGIIWSGKIMVTMPGIFPNENLKNGNLFPNRELIIRAGLIFGNKIREWLKCSKPNFFRHFFNEMVTIR